MRVRDLAEWLGADFEGDGEIELEGVAPIESAGPGELSFINNRKASLQAADSIAGCLIVPIDFASQGSRAVIRTTSPRAAFARAIGKLHPSEPPAPGIHSAAV